MLLSSMIAGRRLSAVIAMLLLVAGVYLAASWFLGYIWAGVWNKGILEHALSVAIGLFFGLIWLGYLLSKKNAFVYWASAITAGVVAGIQIWDQAAGQMLPLKVEMKDIAFTLIALCAVLLRRPSDG